MYYLSLYISPDPLGIFHLLTCNRKWEKAPVFSFLPPCPSIHPSCNKHFKCEHTAIKVPSCSPCTCKLIFRFLLLLFELFYSSLLNMTYYNEMRFVGLPSIVWLTVFLLVGHLVRGLSRCSACIPKFNGHENMFYKELWHLTMFLLIKIYSGLKQSGMSGLVLLQRFLLSIIRDEWVLGLVK